MKSVDYFQVNIEETNWQSSRAELMSVRYPVFVSEQKVPVELEEDQDDINAFHWLASSIDGESIGTARLLSNGQVGRMAVLKQYRGKGVGSALVRALINFAIKKNIPELTLSAQTHAVKFYEPFGFVSVGDPYQEANIEHIKMRIPLSLQQQRYRHHNKSRLVSIAENDRLRLTLDGKEAFFQATQKLIEGSRLKIRIFSEMLLPELYDNETLCRYFYQFATHQPNAQVEVLIQNIDWLTQNTHRLHEIGLRLPSHISFRKLSKEAVTVHNEFIIADTHGVLYKQDKKRFAGYAVHYGRQEARELINDFDLLWEQSQPDPELKHLHI